MIALFVSPETAESLKLPSRFAAISETSIDEFHVTLAYLGNAVDLSEEQIEVFQNVCQQVATFFPPFAAAVGGLGRFFSTDPEGEPVVALVDSPVLIPLRAALSEFGGKVEPFNEDILPYPEHGFMPHITLGYVNRGFMVHSGMGLERVPLEFDSLSLVIAGERFDYPLTGHLQVSGNFDDAVVRGEDMSNLDDSEAHNQSQRVGDEMTSKTSGEELVEKQGRRMSSAMLARLNDAMTTMSDLKRWAEYAEAEEEKSRSFFVVKGTDGEYRWVALSSNAFKDREEEIVSTEALKEYVERADQTGDRGVLRLFHIPGTDIGKCDFQAIEGRFLIESGNFDDTPVARKALEYLNDTDVALGTSIGFTYPESTFEDGVYHHIVRIVERSVLPLEHAANPWTAFSLKGESIVDDRQKAMLEAALGADMASGIIAAAATATKNLEESVAYKSTESEGKGEESNVEEKAFKASEFKAMIDSIPDADTKAKFAESYKELFGKDEEEKKEDKSVEATVADAIKATLEPLASTISESLKALKATSDDLMGRIDTVEKALKDAQEAATAAASKEKQNEEAPRGADMFRASQSDDTVVDAAKAKAIVGDEADKLPVNPIAPYLADFGIK